MCTKNEGGGVIPAEYPGPTTNPVSGDTDLWCTRNGVTLGHPGTPFTGSLQAAAKLGIKVKCAFHYLTAA